MQETSLWAATSAPLKSFAGRPLPASADVVVIGGGYTGVSAALRMAKRGAAVTLIEAQAIGWGASSRNGGQVLTGLKHGVGKMIAEHGLERARELYAATIKTIACVEAIVAEERIDCDYKRCGHLAAAARLPQLDGFRRSQELLARKFGHSTHVVTRGAVRRDGRTGRAHGGHVQPRC